tara:strand:- start:3049 stop:3327 length:279 start_codon:yes stop_codon:yes gene_type:complete
MKKVINAIGQIDNMADLNAVITAVKAQRAKIQHISLAFAKSKFSAGDKVKFFSSRNAGDIHGTIVKVKIKRAVVHVKGEGNWDVPLTMLEVA